MSICPYVISYIHIYIHTSLHIHTYSHVGIFFCSSFHLEFQYMSSDCPCCLGQVAAQDDLNSVSSATPSPSGDYPGAGRRKSPFFIGKSTINVPFSIANYVRIPEGNFRGDHHLEDLHGEVSSQKALFQGSCPRRMWQEKDRETPEANHFWMRKHKTSQRSI